MPKPKQYYVVIESYIDMDGDAGSDLVYAGTSRTMAEDAVTAYAGQECYHEGFAQVAVQTYPDVQGADGMPYAVIEERGHKLFWKVQVNEEEG